MAPETEMKKVRGRRGLYRRAPQSYLLRRRIGGHLYQIPLKAGNDDDAKAVYDLALKEISSGIHGGGTAPTLGALAQGWIKLHRKQERHAAAAAWALDALGNLAQLPLPSITTERVEGWICRYQEDHKPATINMVLRYLKIWMRWALRRKTPGLPGMPYDVPIPKVEKVARPVVKISHQDAFLLGVDRVREWVRVTQLAEPQVRAAVRLMLGLGLREAEVLGARWAWLDLEARVYVVGKAKGMKPRALGVPEWVVPYLQALPRTLNGLVFPGEDGGEHPHGWLRKAIARGAKAAGLTGTVGNHRLRGSFATRHAAAGTSTKDLQDMMGHFSITTTQGYIEEDLERRKAAQDRLAGMMKTGG